ncbi:MAG: DUF819 family protein [Erythrobacter sp.]|uniref:DUF819 family protein n=1 Tax=Erythrobacter sp. TaxID=1042 RepID=UPI002618657A|nr:DUF819 family protein [Erythrobacter sp.]MDJ0978178.1 DUF819 family protein [Erythrobacter sp.]
MDDWTGLWAIGGLFAVMAIAFGSGRFKSMAWLSPPVVALFLVALLVNIGLMPSSSETGAYGLVSGPLLQAAIFLMLLQVDLGVFKRAGGPMLLFFLGGCFAIGIGALVAALFPFVVAPTGKNLIPLAGMFTGTYNGGSVNFNSLAAVYDVNRDGGIYPVALAVDAAMTALWLIVSVAAAPYLRRMSWSKRKNGIADDDGLSAEAPAATPLELAIVGACLVAAIALSDFLAQLMPWGHPLLWLTAVALAAAQTPLGKLAIKVEPLAIVALYLFIAAIGADISIAAVAAAQDLAVALIVLVTVMFTTHAVFLYVTGRFMKADSDVMVVASQAAIGGPPTALAVAEAIGRHDLRVPGVAASLIGYAVGTYWGLAVARMVAGII